MWRLLFRSSTSGVVVGAILAGCHDDPKCGATETTTLQASGSGVFAEWSAFTSGANNDCPDPDAPSGVISLTVTGSTGSDGGFVTLCIPRIDTLGSGGTVGDTLSTADVRIVDVNANVGGDCSISRAVGTPVTGTASATGVCSNGEDPAGFDLTLDATVTVDKDCGGAIDQVEVALSGTFPVGPQ